MVRTIIGKENEALLTAKSPQNHKPAACGKGSAKVQVSKTSDTGDLCQNFSLLNIGGIIDEQAPQTPESASKVAKTDQDLSSASASTSVTASEVNTTAEFSFKTPLPTRPAPRTAFKRKPLGNAAINNAALSQQQAGSPAFYQPPLPVQAPATPQAPLNGAPAAQPAGPYNSYQLPMLPMYPPYTPHPACFDPSGRFSASGPPQAVLNLSSSQALEAWSPEGYWGLPSPCSGNDECASSATAYLNSPQVSLLVSLLCRDHGAVSRRLICCQTATSEFDESAACCATIERNSKQEVGKEKSAISFMCRTQRGLLRTLGHTRKSRRGSSRLPSGWDSQSRSGLSRS